MAQEGRRTPLCTTTSPNSPNSETPMARSGSTSSSLYRTASMDDETIKLGKKASFYRLKERNDASSRLDFELGTTSSSSLSSLSAHPGSTSKTSGPVSWSANRDLQYNDNDDRNVEERSHSLMEAFQVVSQDERMDWLMKDDAAQAVEDEEWADDQGGYAALGQAMLGQHSRERSPSFLRRTQSSPGSSAGSRLTSPRQDENPLTPSPTLTIAPLHATPMPASVPMESAAALSEVMLERSTAYHPLIGGRSRSDSGSAHLLRTRPSLVSIPEAGNSPPRPPRSLARHISLSSNLSKTSTDPFHTPASTAYTPSSGTSSRPPSFSPWSSSDNERHRMSSGSSLTSPSLSSLIDAELNEQIETLDTKPVLPFARSPAKSTSTPNLTVDTSAAPSADALISPSKVGLGIELEQQQGLTVAGRHKSVYPTGGRSRSSSVAERVGRSRHGPNAWTTSPSEMNDGYQKEKRAIGLNALVNEETTHWSLKDCDPVDVMRALAQSADMINLRVLDISNCNLTELPCTLASLRSLEELDISGNKLTTLPPFLASLFSLKVLFADSCGLTNLQYPLSTLSELHSLSLTSNKLSSLPSWLCHLEPSLVYLRIDNNPFSSQWAGLLQPLCMAAPSTPASVDSHAPSSADEDRPSPIDPHMNAPRRPLPRKPSNAGSLAPARPSTSLGTASSVRRGVKKMRSAGDLAFGRSSPAQSPLGLPSPPESDENSTDISHRKSMSLSPEMVLQSLGDFGQLPMPSPTKALPPTPKTEDAALPNEPAPVLTKKRSNFFKKMGSFGRRSNDPPKRPLLAMDQRGHEQRSCSAPEVVSSITARSAQKHFIPNNRHRTSSSAASFSDNTVRTPIPGQLSRSDSTASSASSAMPGISRQHSTSVSTAASDAEDSEVEADCRNPAALSSSTSPLQSIMQYLRDIEDLSADSSPQAVLAALAEAQYESSFRSSKPMSRSSSARQPYSSTLTESSARSSAHSSIFSNGQRSENYSEESFRLAHSSTSTHATTAESSVYPTTSIKLNSDPYKREKLVEEIISSERSYCAGLRELVNIYVTPASQPIKSTNGTAKETVIPVHERRTVFSNIEGLLAFHQEHFLPDLEAVTEHMRKDRNSVLSVDSSESLASRKTAEDVAKVFNRHGAFLRMYSTYVNNFDTAMNRFKTWTSSNSANSSPMASPAVSALGGSNGLESASKREMDALSPTQRKRMKAFLKQCRAHPDHSQIGCDSYLLMPIQRIPRYKMLLESLLSCTPVDDGSFMLSPNPQIAAALDLVSNLATDLNEKKRQAEGRQRLLYWQTRIGQRFKSPLVQPHRSLVREGSMTLQRALKKSSEHVTSESDGAPSLTQVLYLRPEVEVKPLIALLTSDILVLILDNGETNGPISLHSVLRLGQNTRTSCASAFGSEGMLRVVDTRSVLYLKLSSQAEAQSWAKAINDQLATL